MFSAFQLHVIRNLTRHSKVVFEQCFPQFLTPLTRKHFMNIFIFYKKFLSSFSSEGSFEKAYLFMVVFFQFYAEYFTDLCPLLPSPFQSLYKMRKKNEETNDFYRKEKHFRKFSCQLRNMNHATYRYATKKIVYLYILTILLPVQRDRLGLAEQQSFQRALF